MAKYLDENGLLYLWGKIKALFVPQEAGKGLSSNDYTSAEKEKLAGIATGATNVVVNNTLTSSSATEALSAAQGKALNDRIDTIVGDMEEMGGGDMMKATYDANGDGVVDNASALEGHPASYFASAADLAGKLGTSGDASQTTAAFSAAGSRDPIASGETMAVLFGKLLRWLTDLKSVAFSGAYNELSGLPTIPTTVAQLTDAGNYALKSEIAGIYKYKGSVADYSNLPSGAAAGDVYNVESDGMNYAWDGSAWDALGAAFTVETISNSEIDSILAT